MRRRAVKVVFDWKASTSDRAVSEDRAGSGPDAALLLRRIRRLPHVKARKHRVANHRLKSVSGLQESALLLQEREHRRRRMHPVAGTGFGEADASGRATLAQGMILRILSHPEPQHDAFLRVLGRARDEQE